MHVVIVGCDRVGSTLARTLTDAGHSVAAIDRSASAFERFLDDWPGVKVVGFGFDRDTLTEAGIERADALAAVTGGDNTNIIVARVAKETYRVPRVMARIKDPGRASVYERLGVSTVAAVDWTADQAMRRILPDVTPPEWVHSSAGLVLVERRVPDALVGKPLTDLDRGDRWRVVGLARLGRAGLPPASAVLQENDVVIVAAASEAIEDLDAMFAGPAEGGH